MSRPEIVMPDVAVADVDGVPVYWARVDGPVTAVLHFDGGICAERPHERGIQHLIEHLVLTSVGPQTYDYNGFVDLRRVAFSVRGEPEEVRSFFEIVTAGLASVPEERTHHEGGVLGAEAERGSGSTLTNLLYYMYGAAGPGCAALPELAIGATGPADLQRWAAERLVGQRASMFCSTDPSFLDLSRLPAGTAGDPWRVPPMIDGPGWVPGNASGFAAVAVLPRTTATATMIRVLRDHCLDHVRHRDGVSYAVEITYEPLTNDDVIVGLFVDAAPDRRVDARNTLFEALDSFVTQGPEGRWLDLDAGRMSRMMREPTAGVSRAAKAAVDRLFFDDDPLDDSWLDDYGALTPDDLAEAARTFLTAASWQMPPEAPMPPWRGIRRLRLFSEAAVQGRELSPVGSPGYRMIAGPAGLSVVQGPERIATTRFDDVVAVEAWDDGARLLYGRDGTRIMFDPREWTEGPDFVRWLTDSLASAPILQRGPRPDR